MKPSATIEIEPLKCRNGRTSSATIKLVKVKDWDGKNFPTREMHPFPMDGIATKFDTLNKAIGAIKKSIRSDYYSGHHYYCYIIAWGDIRYPEGIKGVKAGEQVHIANTFVPYYYDSETIAKS